MLQPAWDGTNYQIVHLNNRNYRTQQTNNKAVVQVVRINLSANTLQAAHKQRKPARGHAGEGTRLTCLLCLRI